MHPDLLYRLALTLIPHIGPIQAKILLQHYDAPDIFKAKKRELEKIEGIGTIRAEAIRTFNDFKKAEEEIEFTEKFRITPLFITDEQYPRRLLNCYDPPTLLYFKGSADLNQSRIVSIIGTRNNTNYGKHITEKLVQGLSEHNILVVSGLAFGIDAIAHKAAIKYNCATVGVLAHGLDQVYPGQHLGLAKEMIKSGGGLLTEFRSKTDPDRHNFPTRNRVVAGMSDATIVVETGLKGGSMITAELANNYNRDVFAIPGKITDPKSEGCHFLVRNNKAWLLTDARELLEIMGWEKKAGSHKETAKQRALFIELKPDEKLVLSLLDGKDNMHIDEINARSGLSSSSVAAAILNLELQNLILSLPGKLYRLA